MVKKAANRSRSRRTNRWPGRDQPSIDKEDFHKAPATRCHPPIATDLPGEERKTAQEAPNETTRNYRENGCTQTGTPSGVARHPRSGRYANSVRGRATTSKSPGPSTWAGQIPHVSSCHRRTGPLTPRSYPPAGAVLPREVARSRRATPCGEDDRNGHPYPVMRSASHH